MRFTTTIEVMGTSATGFEVPEDVVAALGQGKKPRVHVTIGAHTYRSTVAVMGGRFLLPGARAAFDALNNSTRRGHITNVEAAKAPETRRRRIDKIVADLA